MRCWGPSFVLRRGLLRSRVGMPRIRPSETRQSPPRSVCCGGCSFLRWIDSSCQGYENSNMSPTIPGLCGWASLSEKSYRRSPDLSWLFFSPSSLRHPLELKLFEREIEWYMAHDTQMRAIEAEQLAQEEFPDIENLRTRNQELFQLLRAKEKRRDTLRAQAVAELATNTATRTRLEAQKQQRLAVVKTVAENANGLLARLNALHQLARDRDNLALGWAILVIFFVFLAVETAPVLTKVMFRYGPYDMLLERIETEVVLQESQRLRSAQERITAAAQYRSNPDLQ